MPENFYRRPSGIYVIRIAVPRRLRPVIGRTEIHVSTRQVEINAAKLAGLEILLAWRKRFMELDRSKLLIGSPLLSTNGYIGLRDASEVTGIPLPSLLSELLNFRSPLYVSPSSWAGIRVPELCKVEKDYDGTFIWNSVESLGEQQTLSGLMLKVHDSHSALSNLIVEGVTPIHVLQYPGSAAFFLDESHHLVITQFFVEKTAIEATRSRLAVNLPPNIPHAPSVPAMASPAGPAVYDPITARHGNKKVSELFDMYQSDRSWKADQRRRMTKEANLFIELMKDPKLGTLERETILEYASKLAKIPTDIYQARRKYKVNSLEELVVIAEKDGLAVKSDGTIKRHIGYLSEILNYGVKNHMLRFNPAADFKRTSKKKLASAQSERSTFTHEELERIFSADWFVTGTGKFEAKGWTDWRPFNYWLPLMGLLTGARINELSQLYLDDIRCSELGTWYFDFNLLQPDKVDADESEQDKSLKSVNAIRIIPMHEVLVRLGLPRYVEVLKAKGHTRLFPELKKDPIKGYGKPAGSWFNERFLGKKLKIKRDGMKVFHSLRHNFLTALERLDVSESVRAQLAGHQRGKTESGNRYSKDRNADELKPLINKLVFPYLANIASFNANDGLAAIKIALRLKSENKKRLLRQKGR